MNGRIHGESLIGRRIRKFITYDKVPWLPERTYLLFFIAAAHEATMKMLAKLATITLRRNVVISLVAFGSFQLRFMDDALTQVESCGFPASKEA
jgi:hypothetical protein